MWQTGGREPCRGWVPPAKAEAEADADAGAEADAKTGPPAPPPAPCHHDRCPRCLDLDALDVPRRFCNGDPLPRHGPRTEIETDEQAAFS